MLFGRQIFLLTLVEQEQQVNVALRLQVEVQVAKSASFSFAAARIRYAILAQASQSPGHVTAVRLVEQVLLDQAQNLIRLIAGELVKAPGEGPGLDEYHEVILPLCGRQCQEVAARSQSKDEDWIFVNTHATAPFLADNVLERIIQPTVKKLGITHVTWHLLRHWHTTVLHDEGVSIKATQERLGHSRAETTMKHYIHLS